MKEHSGSGTIIITSTGLMGSPKAKEDEKLGHGVFTYYLIEGLEKGTADENNDGKISISEFFNYASKKVKESGCPQSPKIEQALEEGATIFIGNNPLKIKEKEFESNCDKLIDKYNEGMLPKLFNESLIVLTKDYENPSSLTEIDKKTLRVLKDLLEGNISISNYNIIVQRLKSQCEKSTFRYEKEITQKTEQKKAIESDSEAQQSNREEEKTRKEEEKASIVSILFLAADPTDESRRRLGEEFREIQEELKLAKLRDLFRLELPQLSVRPSDITQALLDTQPRIVHFSGHGTSTGALLFENLVGQTQTVEPDALAALFEQFSGQVDCVILNSCYSEIQAKAIAKHIKYVIGTNKEIGDEAAIAFSTGFYQALGGGRSIEDAYDFGCLQIRLQNIPGYIMPVLIKDGSVVNVTT